MPCTVFTTLFPKKSLTLTQRDIKTSIPEYSCRDKGDENLKENQKNIYFLDQKDLQRFDYDILNRGEVETANIKLRKNVYVRWETNMFAF